MRERVSNIINGIPTWQDINVDEVGEVVREAQRHCPEFLFDRALGAVQQKGVSFYKDYRLVRLTLTSGGQQPASRQEIYGFYATGDFHPLDGTGRAVELLNNIAPLHLTSETVMEYTLLRLEIELPLFYAGSNSTAELRRARIVSDFDELPIEIKQIDKKKQAELAGLLTEPKLMMVPEWEVCKHPDIERGKVFRVVASVVVYHGETNFELIRVFIQVSPDGLLTLSQYNKRSGQLPLGNDPQPGRVISFPRYTRTALPIQMWQTLYGQEADSWRNALDDYGLGRQAEDDKAKQRTIILRKAKLDFYHRYNLLEVLEAKAEGYRRSYALIRAGDGEPVIHPLSGRSDIIHAINKEDNELNLNLDTAADYLRFFCWAVHAEGGPFYIPLHLREIPLLLAPSEENLSKLRKLDFAIHKVSDSEAEAIPSENFEAALIRFKAHVAHESAVFEAWFTVETTGMIKMDRDEPRVTDLTIYKERYGLSDLFVLNKSRQIEPERKPDAQPLEQLPLEKKVLWFDSLNSLGQSWAELPGKVEVSSKDAPKTISGIPQDLRTLLSQLSPEQVASNEALRFLQSLLSEHSAEQKILPTVFLKALEEFLSELRSTKSIGSQDFLQAMSEHGRVSSHHVDELIFLQTASITPDADYKDERHE